MITGPAAAAYDLAWAVFLPVGAACGIVLTAQWCWRHRWWRP